MTSAMRHVLGVAHAWVSMTPHAKVGSNKVNRVLLMK